MNALADDSVFPCIFFEEYKEGAYELKYYVEKRTRIQLYFSKLCQLDNTAEERERIRETIEAEAVRPFIGAYNQSPLVASVSQWQFFTPPPRFDANEVSIMLQWDAVLIGC